MKPRIFISHGAGRDPEVQQVLNLLVPALRDLGYEVFVDVESLRVGDDWNKRLYQEMYSCDAAVVLLGPNTVGMNSAPGALVISDWVLRESEVLVGRHKAGGLRAVLPGLVGQVTTSAARSNGFRSIVSLQLAQAANAGGEEVGAAPEVVAKRILEEVAPVMDLESWSDDWAHRIARFLRTARSVNEDSYIAAANAAGLEKDELFHIRSKLGSELFFAQRLLSGELHRGLPGMIVELRPSLNGTNLRHLADEVFPAWVDHGAAHILTSGAPGVVPRPRTAPDQPALDPSAQPDPGLPGKVMLLDVSLEWTVDQYVQRSMRRAPASYTFQAVPNGVPEDERPAAEALEDLCRKVLRQVFHVPPGFPVNGDTVRPDPGVRNFMALRAQGRTNEELATVVEALHRDFPWLVVIALTSDSECTEESLRKAGSPSVVTVQPKLVLADELAAYRLKGRLDDVLVPAGALIGCN